MLVSRLNDEKRKEAKLADLEAAVRLGSSRGGWARNVTRLATFSGESFASSSPIEEVLE